VKSAIELSTKSITTSTDAIELQIIDVSEQANGALAQIQNSSSPVGHIVGAVDGITSVVDNVVPIANTWDFLLKKVDLFTKIIDGIAEVRLKCNRLFPLQNFTMTYHGHERKRWQEGSKVLLHRRLSFPFRLTRGQRLHLPEKHV
jgi:hypothetical protein